MSFRPRAMGVSQAGRLLMVFGLLITSLNLTFFAPVAAHAAAPVTADPNAIDSSALVAQTSLKNSDKVVGKASGSQVLHMGVSLKESNPAAETAFINDLYNSKSANYRHFLTTAQYNLQFGPSQAERDTVVSYLQSKGFQVDNSNSGTFIDFEGTVSQAEATFNVNINNYQSKNGRTYYSNDKTAAYPQALSNYINTVTGLSNKLQPLNNLQLRTPNDKPATAPGNTGYSPTELRNAYNVTSLYNAGFDGTGQTVALFELDGYDPANIANYIQTYNLGSPKPINVSVDGASVFNQDGNGEVEVELDIETVLAVAPKAQVVVYVGPSTYGYQNYLDTYQKIANDDTAAQVSTSWFAFEDQLIAEDPNLLSANSQIFRQMAIQGQSFYSAAGDRDTYFVDDSGTTDYYLNQLNFAVGYPGDERDYLTYLAVSGGQAPLAPVTNPPITPNEGDAASVGYPADDPYVTGVGGTSLYTNGLENTSSYNSETTWNWGFLADPTYKWVPIGGGGGLSQYFFKSQTPWQVGPGTVITTTNPGGYRQVPDVAADADPDTGIGIYTNEGVGSGWYGVGGTSFATPLWAGFTAVMNQYSTKNNGAKLGFAAPTLYGIYNNATKYANDFHDINNGTIDPNCPNPVSSDTCFPLGTDALYTTTVGYDLATGIGTPNVANLAKDVATSSSVTQLIASPTNVNMSNGPYYPNTATVQLNSLGNSINYTSSVVYYGTNSNWLIVNNPSGTVPANVTTTLSLSINASNVVTGANKASILFTDTANLQDTFDVEVEYEYNAGFVVTPTLPINLTEHSSLPVSGTVITVTSTYTDSYYANVGVLEDDEVGAIVAYPAPSLANQILDIPINIPTPGGPVPSPVAFAASGFPVNVVVAANPAAPAGTYTATIVVSNLYDPLDQVRIPVTATIAPPDVTAAPSVLVFTTTVGGPNPAPQTATFNLANFTGATPVSGTINTYSLDSSDTNWLTTNPSGPVVLQPGGSLPVTVSVNLNPANGSPITQPGTYFGRVRLSYNCTNSSPSSCSGAARVTVELVVQQFYTYGLPFVANNYNGFTDFLSIQNANPVTATVGIQYYNASGSPVSADNKVIPPYGSASFQPNVVSGTAVTGIISSTAPLNVVVPEATPVGGSAYALGSTAAATLYDPIAQNNGTFQTQLTVQNVAAVTTTVTVSFYKDADGSQVVSGTQTFSLAPYTSKTLDQSAANSGLSNFSGWALITGTTGSQLVAQVLEQNPSAKFVAILSASATPANTIYAPAVFSSYLGSFNTGMNIVNTGSVPATITVSYYSVSGTLVTTQSFPNVAAHAITGIYQPFVSGLGSTFNGSAIISSTQPVVVGVNENGGKTAAGNSESGTYTGLVSGGTSVGVPVQAFGAFGGYVTGSTVQNLTSQTITVTYQYLDVNGFDEGSPQILTIAPHASGQLFQGAANQNLPNGYFGTALVTSNVPNSIAIVTNAVNAAFFYTFTSPASS